MPHGWPWADALCRETMTDTVRYTWEVDGPLGLGIAADGDGIVVESVIDEKVARAVVPGMFVITVAGQPISDDADIDDVIALIQSSPRPLTIEFEEREWDDSIDMSEVEPEVLELSDVEPSSGSEAEDAGPVQLAAPIGRSKVISGFITNTIMTSPMYRQKHRNLATVQIRKPLGIGFVCEDNGDISVCAVPGEEAQSKKISPGMILVEVSGTLLTREWKLTDVCPSSCAV